MSQSYHFNTMRNFKEHVAILQMSPENRIISHCFLPNVSLPADFPILGQHVVKISMYVFLLLRVCS